MSFHYSVHVDKSHFFRYVQTCIPNDNNQQREAGMPDQNRTLQLRHLSPDERRRELTRAAPLTDEEGSLLSGMDPISTDRIAERIENGIGVLNIPVGVAEHFVVNGRAIPGIPMATE